MGKTSNLKKIFGKKSKKKRFSRKIRFIRLFKKKAKSFSSEKRAYISHPVFSENFILDSYPYNSKTDNYVNLSTINMANKFIQRNLSPKKNDEQIHKFYDILKKLCFKTNEFVVWTIFIEYYKNFNSINDTFEEETLFYIGLFAKEALGNNSNENYTQIINREKMEKIKSILETKKIDTIEFNKQFKSLSNNTQQKKNTHYDINQMIEYIYNANKINIPKKDNNIKSDKEKVFAGEIKKDQNNNNENNIISYTIDNDSHRIFGQGKNINENQNEDEKIFNYNMTIPGIDKHDYEVLPTDEDYFMKQVEELNKTDLSSLFFIKNK